MLPDPTRVPVLPTGEYFWFLSWGRLRSPDRIPKLPTDQAVDAHLNRKLPLGRDRRRRQCSARIGPARRTGYAKPGTRSQARRARLWGGEGGCDQEFDLDAPRQAAAGEAPRSNACTPNRALYIPWGRNRSSLSRLGQFEQPRQQTRSTATPTVTRMATRLPFIENQ